MKYGFYPGCTYNSAAGYRESVEALNRKLGIELEEISDWNCCGATAVFSLSEPEALAITGRVFALAEKQGTEQIVMVCNACYITMRKAAKVFSHYPEKLAETNTRLSAEGLRLTQCPRVRHYLEVLYHDVPEKTWKELRSKDNSAIRVGAYYGCQFTRPWGDADHPERPSILENLMERLGFSVAEHSAKTACCGASHSVAYADKCQSLISRIINEIRNKKGQVITTICPLCQFNLDAAQRNTADALPVPYFTQLAGLAIGIDPKELGMSKLLVPLKL